MKLIIDNNILFSLMNPRSGASQIFQRKDLELSAPKFILSEFNKHIDDCRRKSHLSSEAFSQRKLDVESQIQFIDVQEYKSFLKKTIHLMSDLNDVPYLACALSQLTSIWSNDSHFKEQTVIQVFTTKDLLTLLPFD